MIKFKKTIITLSNVSTFFLILSIVSFCFAIYNASFLQSCLNEVLQNCQNIFKGQIATTEILILAIASLSIAIVIFLVISCCIRKKFMSLLWIIQIILISVMFVISASVFVNNWNFIKDTSTQTYKTIILIFTFAQASLISYVLMLVTFGFQVSSIFEKKMVLVLEDKPEEYSIEKPQEEESKEEDLPIKEDEIIIKETVKVVSSDESSEQKEEVEKVISVIKEEKPLQEVKEELIEEPKAVIEEVKKDDIKPAVNTYKSRKSPRIADLNEEKPKKKVIYIITHRKDLNKWQIKLNGSAKAISLYDNIEDAIKEAKQLCLENNATLRVHGIDGKLQSV